MSTKNIRKKKPKKNTSFTTWKINLENTINADPLTDGACLQVVRAYLDWMGAIDARPYLSIIHLRVATSMHENSIIRARRLLVGLGYFEKDSVTSSGAVRYKIVNSRENIVLDHQIAARETLLQLEAEKKERDRTKRKMRGVSPAESEGPLSPSEYEGLNGKQPFRIRRDSPSESEGNYVYYSVEAISMEEERYLTDDIQSAEFDSDLHLENRSSDTSIKIDPPENGYALQSGGDDSDRPLPIPDCPDEADAMMDVICEGRSVGHVMRNRLLSMLMNGLLTTARVESILGLKREEAA